MFVVDPKIRVALRRSISVMPELAADLIRHHHNMHNTANQHFAENPDDPAMHEFHWHQFGIITHCQRFQQQLESVVPSYLKKWGLAEAVSFALKQPIDGVEKWQLLQLAALWHDVGKFTARQAYVGAGGRHGFSFKGHEIQSGELIRGELHPFFEELQLTDAQIAYIAKVAELHFELGKLRREAKLQYTLQFARSPQCLKAMEDIIKAHLRFAPEIGLCFLADSLSKVEIYATAESDDEIKAQRLQLEANISARNFSPLLINAALQMPVNVEVTRLYLKTWLQGQGPRGVLWIKLDVQSVQLLKKTFPPQFTQQFYHHVTLAFNITEEDSQPFVGQMPRFSAYAYATNGSVEAVRVKAANLPDTYGVPHITLSTQAGIQPFKAVEMLKGQHREEVLEHPLELAGSVEFVPFSKI